jgi:hypothetical protein
MVSGILTATVKEAVADAEPSKQDEEGGDESIGTHVTEFLTRSGQLMTTSLRQGGPHGFAERSLSTTRHPRVAGNPTTTSEHTEER